MNQTTKEQGKQVREEILKSIIEYIEKYGYPPTVRDIGEMTGLKSTSSVKNHLDQMIAEGLLETDHECSPRAIRVPGYRFVREEDIDKLYLASCEEINELKRQINELQMAEGYAVERLEAYMDEAEQFGVSGMMADMAEAVKEVLELEDSEEKPEPVRYCYSWDGENYSNGLFATKEEAVLDAKAVKQIAGYDDKEIYVARAITPDLSWNSNVEYILNSMLEDLHEQCGEYADGALGITEEMEQDLEKRLSSQVRQWIARYKIKPICYKAVSPEIWEVPE